MAQRQYVAVRFHRHDRATYTYHHDGDALIAVGDKVIVETKRGPSEVEIVSFPEETPSFETKPIVGKARPLKENNDG